LHSTADRYAPKDGPLAEHIQRVVETFLTSDDDGKDASMALSRQPRPPFLKQVSSRVFEVDDGELRISEGNYDYYLSQKPRAHALGSGFR
jgi:hypothetical protein